MIKRITNPLEFEKAVGDIFELFDLENETMGHALLKHNKEYIIIIFIYAISEYLLALIIYSINII